MPGAGLEPARDLAHWILSPARLPIPPPRQDGNYKVVKYKPLRVKIPNMGGNHHKVLDDRWITDEVVELEREYEKEIEKAEEIARGIIKKAQEKALSIIQSAEEEGIELIKAHMLKGRLKGEKDGEKILENAKKIAEYLRNNRESKAKIISMAIVRKVLGE